MENILLTYDQVIYYDLNQTTKACNNYDAAWANAIRLN